MSLLPRLPGIELLFGCYLVLAHTAPAAERVLPFAFGRGLQSVTDWGITPAPLNWDGRSMLGDDEKAVAIYRELGVSVVRFVVGGISCYDNQRSQANISFFEGSLLADVRRADAAGVKRYILSFLTPPPYMKTRYTYRPYIDGVQAKIRGRHKELYANYIADVMKLLKERNLQLPVSIGIQTQPDAAPINYGCPPTLSHGTLYSREEWIELACEVRRVLDRSGFSAVGLIGPETGGGSWLDDEVAGVARLFTTAKGGPILAGFSYVSPGLDLTDAFSLEAPFELGVIKTSVWMLASNPVNAQNDEEVLLMTFGEIYRDIFLAGTSHWFFRYAYGPVATAETLLFGDTLTSTPTYMALKRLWNDAPPGSQAVELQPLAEVSTKGIYGFSFCSPAQVRILVFVNVGSERCKVVPPPVISCASDIVTFASPNFHPTPVNNGIRTHELGPRSVLIIRIK